MNEPEVPGQDEDLYVWDESDLGPTALDTERGRAELISELNGLRSRIQILRAERTAMAGKKYALEVMLEGTQTKVLEMDELLRTSGDPPAAQLAQLAELVHQAKLVAEGRGSSKDGLEAERLAQLEAMNVLEGRLAEGLLLLLEARDAHLRGDSVLGPGHRATVAWPCGLVQRRGCSRPDASWGPRSRSASRSAR